MLALFNDKHVFEYNIYNHFASTLEHALNVLRCMVNERIFMNLGPPHTQAKSRDHEIVRAQQKVS